MIWSFQNLCFSPKTFDCAKPISIFDWGGLFSGDTVPLLIFRFPSLAGRFSFPVLVIYESLRTDADRYKPSNKLPRRDLKKRNGGKAIAPKRYDLHFDLLGPDSPQSKECRYWLRAWHTPRSFMCTCMDNGSGLVSVMSVRSQPENKRQFPEP